MQNVVSSPYVKAKCLFLKDHFAGFGWLVTVGSRNVILIYNPSSVKIKHTFDEMSELIFGFDLIDKPTGLRMSPVKYYFFDRGDLLYILDFLPGAEFDV